MKWQDYDIEASTWENEKDTEGTLSRLSWEDGDSQYRYDNKDMSRAPSAPLTYKNLSLSKEKYALNE